MGGGVNVYLDFLFVYSNITVAKRLEFVQSIISEQNAELSVSTDI